MPPLLNWHSLDNLFSLMPVCVAMVITVLLIGEICPPVHMIGIWLQMQHPQIGQPQVNLVRLQKTTVVPLRLQILHCTLQIAVIQI